MKKERLEIFSDGIMAIVITIMVLEMKAPEDTTFEALRPVIPTFLSYVLSFVYIAIYWINHHHLFQSVDRVNAIVLWSNMHLLFWLSLIPFTTSWMGENHLESIPVAFYGGILLMCALAYRILENTILQLHKQKTSLVSTLRGGKKEKLSILLYFVAIPLAFVNVFISIGCYVSVAIIWFIPSRKLESALNEKEQV